MGADKMYNINLRVFLPVLLYLISSIRADEGLRERRDNAIIVKDDRKVVCYYTNWAVYRTGDAKFTPGNINPYLCTHLIYAFGGISNDDTIIPFDSYQDIEKGGYGAFAALKTYNKDLKTLLAIGGWNEGSKRFSPLVADPARRQTLIRSCLRFLRQYNFDGLDLDWEYPTLRAGGRPEDRENYALFVKELREAFELEAQQTKKDRLLITMAVTASLEYAAQAYDIPSLDQNLDFWNLLTYDYHSSQEPAANHHSPLFRPDDWSDFDFRKDLNVDATIKFYVKSGASRNKLVLGIPTYGRSYTLANPDAHEVGSPTLGPGAQGSSTKEDGYLAYYEICVNIIDKGWSVGNPYPGVMGPYAYKGDQWVGFDNVDIAVEKAFYVAEEGLGGIMFWTLDNDDFRGTCSKTPYPLIESAKEAMYSVQSTVNVKSSTSVSVSTSSSSSRTRLTLSKEELKELTSAKSVNPPVSLVPVRPAPPPRPVLKQNPQRSTTTPAPPTTPSSGPAFLCSSEGFYPHPGTCKKYYWCLDTPNQGVVAHTFTCPRSLYFNKVTDGCDFRTNVDCDGKDDKETEPEVELPEDDETDADADDSVEDPKSLKDILEIVKNAGGIEGLEKQIQEEEEQKKEVEERKIRISNKTRSRLSQLLNRVNKSEPAKPAERESEVEVSTSPTTTTTTTTKAPSRPSFLDRLKSRRRLSRPTPTTNAPNQSGEIEIVGAHLQPKEEEPQSLRSGLFKPKEGQRERLRQSLQSAIEDGNLRDDSSSQQEQQQHPTSIPASNPTISKNTRIEEALTRPREQPRLGATRTPLDNAEDNRFVTIDPLVTATPAPLQEEDLENQLFDDEEEGSSAESLRPTLPNLREFDEVDPLPPTQDQSTTDQTIQGSHQTSAEDLNFQTSFGTTTSRGSQTTSRGSQTTSRGSQTPAELFPRDRRLGQTFRGRQQPDRQPDLPDRRPEPTSRRRQTTRPSVRLETTTEFRPRDQPRRLTGFQEQPRRQEDSSRDNTFFDTPEQNLFNLVQENIRQPNPSNIRNQPSTNIASFSPSRTPAPTRDSESPIAPVRSRLPARVPEPFSRVRDLSLGTLVDPVDAVNPELEYEYYYDYLDTVDGQHNPDYDLVPLVNKVRIQADGIPHCLDVGVFPHPFSCKQFINCFRNPGTGITGSIYKCPSYLAFDPVGGRCNWVSEIVCQQG